MDTTFARRVNAWVSSLIASRDVWRGSVRDCVHLCRSTGGVCDVRDGCCDSDVCTFRHTGQRCLHVSSHRTGCETQARAKNRAAIIPFIFFLSFFVSLLLLLLFIRNVGISTV